MCSSILCHSYAWWSTKITSPLIWITKRISYHPVCRIVHTIQAKENNCVHWLLLVRNKWPDFIDVTTRCRLSCRCTGRLLLNGLFSALSAQPLFNDLQLSPTRKQGLYDLRSWRISSLNDRWSLMPTAPTSPRPLQASVAWMTLPHIPMV